MSIGCWVRTFLPAVVLAGCAWIVWAAEPRLLEPIRPVEPVTDVSPQVRDLGRLLFHDARLSGDGTISCASCHVLAQGGDDGRRVSIGIGGALGLVNSPSVFHADQLFRQFWDGRARDLHQQIDGPIQSDIEMGTEWPDIVALLYEDLELLASFERAFGVPEISRERIKDALVGFIRTLRTLNSPFDRWLGGDDSALSEEELRGYELFKSYGCFSCHQGQAVGGNVFQMLGVLNPESLAVPRPVPEYFKERAARGDGDITEADYGRYNVTGAERDRFVFKVPSLRMVGVTAPYLHDGTASTLLDAVNVMFLHQLGRDAPDEDKEAIVAFLLTLMGDHPELDVTDGGSE